MALLIDFNDPEMMSKILHLQPTSGYCVFIDIVGSTSMKAEGLSQWCAKTAQVVESVRFWLGPRRHLLKSIGDCLMFYTPDRESGGRAARDLLNDLCNIGHHGDPCPCQVHTGVAYCQDAYEITFVPGTKDIHGKDIDLAARLAHEAAPGEIVMNEPFHRKLREDCGDVGGRGDLFLREDIKGPWPAMLKGFQTPIMIYKLPRIRGRGT